MKKFISILMLMISLELSATEYKPIEPKEEEIFTLETNSKKNQIGLAISSGSALTSSSFFIYELYTIIENVKENKDYEKDTGFAIISLFVTAVSFWFIRYFISQV